MSSKPSLISYDETFNVFGAYVFTRVRAISDPLEHLVNQVQIRHQQHILRIEFFVNSLKNEKYVTKPN